MFTYVTNEQMNDKKFLKPALICIPVFTVISVAVPGIAMKKSEEYK